jgi:predicted GIY-YIG superfamily endonuclease
LYFSFLFVRSLASAYLIMASPPEQTWGFTSQAEVAANLAACGPTNPLLCQPAVYLDTNGLRIYVGKTLDVRRRLRQHNGGIAGGGRTTKAMRNKTATDRLWCVAIVTGFADAKQALQFEYRCHRFRRKLARDAVFAPDLQEGIRQACASAPLRLPQFRLAGGYVQVLFHCLSLSRWTKSAPLACTVPLVVHWFDERFRPCGDGYLPAHVTERSATPDEQRYLYAARPREQTTSRKRTRTTPVTTTAKRVCA